MQLITIQYQEPDYTPLSSYLKNKKEFVCLDCTLPICIEEQKQSGECPYTIKVSRSDYFRERYVAKARPLIPKQKCKFPGCDREQRGELCKPHYKTEWQRIKKGVVQPNKPFSPVFEKARAAVLNQESI